MDNNATDKAEKEGLQPFIAECDRDGNIFGIKGYGVINKKHHYGTLDTIDDYFWGEYRAYKKG